MKLKKILLIFYFCAFPVFTNAQINHSFVDYLSNNNLRREHLAYLRNLSDQTSTDTLSYLKAKYYLQYFNDSLFYINYSNCKKIFINDTITFNKANILFLKPGITDQIRWFNSFENESLSFVSKNISYAYQASILPSTVIAAALPASLQHDFLNYKKKYNKKPLIGGALSAAIPGLGKLYVGRPRSFVATFLTHVIYGVQSYESIQKLGLKNPFSVFSLSFFSVFYIANIYSSYHDVFKVKKETRNQFLINASNYYDFNYSYNAN